MSNLGGAFKNFYALNYACFNHVLNIPCLELTIID
jgi:hypothetical protein